MGMFTKLKGKLKRIKDKLPKGMSLSGAPDPVVERNELLEKANFYYEFPMFSIENPPNNSYIDYCLAHAQQRCGYKATEHTGPMVNSKHHSGSLIQEPFSGVIAGNEIRYTSKLWMLLVPVFGIGLIIKLLQPRPRRNTIIYWGVNVYQPQRVMEMISEKEVSSAKIDGTFEILKWGSKMHPVQTILHISIGLAERRKRVKTRDVLQQKFELIKRAIDAELSMKPMAFSADNQTKEHQVEPLFVRKHGVLKGVQGRFPY